MVDSPKFCERVVYLEPIKIFFDKGSLLLKNVPEDARTWLTGLRLDDRVNMYRAPAMRYRDFVMAIRARKLAYEDHAKDFSPMDIPVRDHITPRSYQAEAAKAWMDGGRRGVVVLPTGAGKTLLAVMLIEKTRRPTLIHVPTIDLLHQWHSVLQTHLNAEIGLWGGGYNETRPITVSTYDSALLHVEQRGNLFGLVVFDECHRLPGDQYQFLAISNLAPFRLGLTATPQRTDGKESRLYNYCGPLAYQADIHQLTGDTLAPYDVVTLEVEMQEAERFAYEEAYAEYRTFLTEENISFRGPRGWQNFLYQASRTPRGRSAFKAYLRQKKLSQASAAKDDMVWRLLQQHREDRILIFTQDNEMAYRLGKKFLLPVITHQTRLKERERFLAAFRGGDYRILQSA